MVLLANLYARKLNKRSDLSVYFMLWKLKMMIVNEGGNSLGQKAT
jgi:hypothetical protein